MTRFKIGTVNELCNCMYIAVKNKHSTLKLYDCNKTITILVTELLEFIMMDYITTEKSLGSFLYLVYSQVAIL